MQNISQAFYGKSNDFLDSSAFYYLTSVKQQQKRNEGELSLLYHEHVLEFALHFNIVCVTEKYNVKMTYLCWNCRIRPLYHFSLAFEKSFFGVC